MMMLSEYYKKRFGSKIYKLALNADVTCPNRDGTLGSRGCIFCSEGGSGEFAPDKKLSIEKQIEQARERVSGKIKNGKYIAFFQSYTNTYAPVSYLEKIFYQAIKEEDIVGISIATRPDCLPEEILTLLEKLNREKSGHYH
jgi:radical SAM protein (TIGR01212 family)